MIFKQEEENESEQQINSIEDVWSSKYKIGVMKQLMSLQIYENLITSFSLALLKKRLNTKYFTIQKQWMAKESKLYIYVDIH